ncbi:MAG: hypothetical protein HYS83_01850 [Candidatus Blackburnbacteria bacterium]|nr:hypothetical protein [Candidatus Blackburnbacteria bacterium]
MSKIPKRKNFLLSFAVALLLWLSWLAIFLFIPPEAFFVPIVFLAVTFLAIFLTVTILFSNTRRGLLTALGAIIFMILNYYHATNYLNIVLVGGVLLTIEYYLSRK